MTASWLRRMLVHADASTSTLRATLWLLVLLDARSEDRAAIEHELAIRAWAKAVERHLGEHHCVWTTRGGRS